MSESIRKIKMKQYYCEIEDKFITYKIMKCGVKRKKAKKIKKEVFDKYAIK